MSESWSTGQRWIAGTALAGTLDILMPIADTWLKGKDPLAMLRNVASGPFPGAGKWGLAGSGLGLLVHFAIMAVMVAVFLAAHRRTAWIRENSLIAGALYGVGLWLFMYGLVLPIRFGAPFPSGDAVEIAKQLFAHVVLVGLTIGWVAKR